MDYLTDKLISNKCHKLVFKYLRLFCDVEKFKDDSKEYMSKKGMGVVYTNDCNNIITIPNKYFNKKEKRLSSVMLEINKRIYLKNKDDFCKLKKSIDDYYNKIQLL